MSQRPQNVGIKAMEIYFPQNAPELEVFDGVSKGKYTIGLGQSRMSFCDDREDGYSIALTVLSSLMKKYAIDPKSIGRLEVGTESLLDKSKSCKSVLMQLFAPSGNNNIEGVDTVNACYGGTNALFNAINWIESSGWDGRDAIVVAADIALYEKGNARPTGGAGGVAMLIGPDAPIVFDPGMRGTYMKHIYDFYKPNLMSEYPVVDGHYSVGCYTEALDACYKDYHQKKAIREKASTTNGNDINKDDANMPIDIFDYLAFHSPYCKVVMKAYARLLYNDYISNPLHPAFESVPPSFQDITYEKSLTDKSLEKHFISLSKEKFNQRVQPALLVPNMCGNMYCASVYGSLLSLLCNVGSEKLQGKKIGIFSYGAGLASSLFSATIKGDISHIVRKVNLKERLNARTVLSPAIYDEICLLREEAYQKRSYKPAGIVAAMTPGTYYLTEVDDLFRRSYAVKE
ncbi:hydroxymethylglutaryl-coenzyme A synthase C terminal-domain-containing protein [Xylogone sp. PMI_703]|nr:hydroxymethylglutaryl-coenzyme A synthase C terminal-domain-containing protein [Xylogone sp. PMI_703]